MTETAGCLTCSARWDRRGNNVGGVLPCLKMQLRDVPEYGFLSSNDPPSGEIYVKGNSVFKGYYKDQEMTSKVVDKEGWLRTGDIAIYYPNGSLKIIDRVKELAKLQSGTFIAPQKLENLYINAPLINQILVDVNSLSGFLVAIVSCVEEKLI